MESDDYIPQFSQLLPKTSLNGADFYSSDANSLSSGSYAPNGKAASAADMASSATTSLYGVDFDASSYDGGPFCSPVGAEYSPQQQASPTPTKKKKTKTKQRTPAVPKTKATAGAAARAKALRSPKLVDNVASLCHSPMTAPPTGVMPGELASGSTAQYGDYTIGTSALPMPAVQLGQSPVRFQDHILPPQYNQSMYNRGSGDFAAGSAPVATSGRMGMPPPDQTMAANSYLCRGAPSQAYGYPAAVPVSRLIRMDSSSYGVNYTDGSFRSGRSQLAPKMYTNAFPGGSGGGSTSMQLPPLPPPQPPTDRSSEAYGDVSNIAVASPMDYYGAGELTHGLRADFAQQGLQQQQQVPSQTMGFDPNHQQQNTYMSQVGYPSSASYPPPLTNMAQGMLQTANRIGLQPQAYVGNGGYAPQQQNMMVMPPQPQPPSRSQSSFESLRVSNYRHDVWASSDKNSCSNVDSYLTRNRYPCDASNAASSTWSAVAVPDKSSLISVPSLMPLSSSSASSFSLDSINKEPATSNPLLTRNTDSCSLDGDARLPSLPPPTSRNSSPFSQNAMAPPPICPGEGGPSVTATARAGADLAVLSEHYPTMQRPSPAVYSQSANVPAAPNNQKGYFAVPSSIAVYVGSHSNQSSALPDYDKEGPPVSSQHSVPFGRTTTSAVDVTGTHPTLQQQLMNGSSHKSTASLAVLMPKDHRRSAVQVNIQSNNQPTTLIALYQLPASSAASQQPALRSNQCNVSSGSGGGATAELEAHSSQTMPQEPTLPSVDDDSAKVGFGPDMPAQCSAEPSSSAWVINGMSPSAVNEAEVKTESDADGSEAVGINNVAAVGLTSETKTPKPGKRRSTARSERKRNRDTKVTSATDSAAECSSVAESESLQDPASVSVDSLQLNQFGTDEADSLSAVDTATKSEKSNRRNERSRKHGVSFKYGSKPAKSRRKRKKFFDSDDSGNEKSSKTEKHKVTENKAVEAESNPPPENMVETRRSERLTKRKHYVDDYVSPGSDEEVPNSDVQAVDLVPAVAPYYDMRPCVVEKLLAYRMVAQKKDGDGNEEASSVEQYFVKYKDLSFIHCAWKTVDELELTDKRIHQKVKRFHQKRQKALYLDECDEDEPFNPDFVTVDRIIDVATVEAGPLQRQPPASKDDEATVATTTATTSSPEEETSASRDKADEKPRLEKRYLVKWRSLPYDESTWESEKDVDPLKVEEFQRRSDYSLRAASKARPKANEWCKMAEGPEYKCGNKLRDYQLEGLNWLLFCWYNRRNCILADEMGLGKTIQSITFLQEMCRYGIRGPFLVIAPLSTIVNWQREFENWSDINVIVYHGTTVSRQMIQTYDMYFKNGDGTRLESEYKFEALITTYEMVLADCEIFKKIVWKALIIDEAHRLKNRNCKLLSELSTFRVDHRVLLTGTPLQNNVEELFSLLNFLEPQQFSNSELFLSEFGTLQTDDQVQKLQEILKPMMLRRLKEDVEKSLKPKEETIIEVELTNTQKKYYRAILERNYYYLSRGASVPSLMNTMMELRKCCNHPFLINGAEDQIITEYRAAHKGRDLSEDELYQKTMVQSSGKLVLIDKLLPRLRSTGHKVLIFSQMVKCLDILEEYLYHQKYTYERIDGSVRGDLRQAAIDRFSKPDSDRFIFLLCTRAGGLGINLTAADTVIIFDSDWNPQNDLQAQARCHRIGQEKFVKVYRLITRNSYEREMFDRASLKLGLDKALLQSMGNSRENVSAHFSKKEIEELLKKGAYGAVMDENNECDKFCEEDIDQILQRRTQTITIESGVKGSSFAKATFASTDDRSDIDVNDPNFWQKWAKKASIDPEMNPESELILYEPRQRKRRFEDKVFDSSNQSELESGSESDDTIEPSRRRRLKSRRKRNKALNAEAVPVTDELSFTKADYFRIEKALSSYGWGRWPELLDSCSVKQKLTEADMEILCRTLLLHCLRQYSGDEKLREFTWELIAPRQQEAAADATGCQYGSLGASPRSRKHRQVAASDSSTDTYYQGWAALPLYNPPSLVVDAAYQRHLQRHANKLLLRIRLLHYLCNEIIKDLALEINSGKAANEINLDIPWHPDGPAPWWDNEADKSLLIGFYKHGLDNVKAIRLDPNLCFLQRCGPPSEVGTVNTEHSCLDFDEKCAETAQSPSEEKAPPSESEAVETTEPAYDEAKIKTEKMADEKSEPEKTGKPEGEQNLKLVGEDKKSDGEVEKSESVDDKEADGGDDKSEDDEKDKVQEQRDEKKPEGSEQIAKPVKEEEKKSDALEFPCSSDLMSRFKKLVALFQHTLTMNLMKEEQLAKKVAKQALMQTVLQKKEMKRMEVKQKWSRREECDFYKTIVSFGLEQDVTSGEYIWTRFKDLARLGAKYDQTLNEYLNTFLIMCKKVCRRKLTPEEERVSAVLETLTEERGIKVLQRIEFMSQIRAVVTDRNLEERLKGAKPSADLPPWWETGKHDAELLRAVAKHGLCRSENQIINDPEFSFGQVFKEIREGDAATRTVTRQLTRLSEQIGGGKTAIEETKTASAAEEKPDTEKAISLILADQSCGFLQWPKERVLINRLKSLCFFVERGEWPSNKPVMVSDVDRNSMTPDTPAASNTPVSMEDALANHYCDMAVSAVNSSVHNPVAFADVVSYSNKRSLNKTGRKSGISAGVGSGGNGVRPRKPAATTSRDETDFNLADADSRERMLAMMHQSFLQQLEQCSLAMPFPFGIPNFSTLLAAAGSSLNAAAAPASNEMAATEKKVEGDVLNLSKKKTNDTQKWDVHRSRPPQNRSASAVPESLPFNDLEAMASLPADTRVPVVNLKDGSRLSGDEAPTLRNLASWLSKRPSYVIDMSPRRLPTNSSNGTTELEPGEIVRHSTAHASSVENAGAANKKTGSKLVSHSVPSNHCWSSKNFDWTLDSATTTADRAKKVKPSENEGAKKGDKSPVSRSSVPGMPEIFAASRFDPLQLSSLFPLSATQNFLRLPGVGGGGLPGFSFFPDISSEGLSHLKDKSSSPSTSIGVRGSSGQRLEAASSAKTNNDVDSAAAALDRSTQMLFNQYLLSNSQASSGIFGLNPLLAAAGMIPQLGIFPPNMAAMAQLQLLMDLQNRTNSGGGASHSSPSGVRPPPTVDSVKAERAAAERTAPKRSVTSTNAGNKRSQHGSGNKISSVVSKLAETAVSVKKTVAVTSSVTTASVTTLTSPAVGMQTGRNTASPAAKPVAEVVDAPTNSNNEEDPVAVPLPLIVKVERSVPGDS